MKKFLAMLLATMLVLSMGIVAFAETTPTTVTTEGDLRNAVAAGGEIVLGDNITITGDSIVIDGGQNVTLNLNGKTLSRSTKVIIVEHGTLSVVGSGTIKENDNDGYAPIYIKGSDNPGATNYSVVNVGKDVVLGGWAGIFITPIATNNAHAYGVVVDFAGTINSPADAYHTAAGHGIYINGNIKDITGAVPKINVASSARITSKGTGIYAAGYAEWTVAGNIEADKVGIEIRAGKMDITGGNIVSNGPFTEGPNGNGTTTSGVGVAVSQHTTNLPIEVNISGGNISGEKAVYEKDQQGAPVAGDSSVEVNISGGKYTGSLEIVDNNTGSVSGSVTGGEFSSDVSAYVPVDTAVGTVGGRFVVSEEDIKNAVSNAEPGTAVAIIKGSVTLENGVTLGEGSGYTVPAPTPDPKPVYRDTVTITIGSDKNEPAPEDKGEENPNTGAPVLAPVFAVLVAAGAVAAKIK